MSFRSTCLVVWLLVPALWPAAASAAAATLTVAVASSLYPAMQRQARAFEAAHDVSLRLIPGATGRLYNQVMHGAPFDILIAAGDGRPASLVDSGRAVALYDMDAGRLGIRIDRSPGRPEQLADPSVRHIAIANPESAPFGRAARALLKKRGLWRQLMPKMVYAQNAMQARMMVDRGLVDAGLVPVAADARYLATVPYRMVLLRDSPVARIWAAGIARLTAD